MKFITSLALSITTTVLVLAAGTASATNGYFTHGTGTKNKGMAGAGIALTGDAISFANNPAAALFATGRLDVGAALFSPQRSYSTSASLAQGNGGAFTVGPNNIDSAREYFVIPHIAYNWALDSESAIGVAFYGRGGMNTTWHGGTAMFDPDGPGPAPVMTLPGTFGDGSAGVDLSQAFLDFGYARKVNDSFAWGAALVFAAQVFEAKGVGSFAPFTRTFATSGGMQFPTNLSGNGHDTAVGFGAKFGLQAELSPTTSLAAMYQTKTSMSEFDSYADLFAQSGGFDVPANAKIGITFRPSDDMALSFDVEHTWFNDVNSVGNAIANIFACPTAGAGGMDLNSCLGGGNGAGFGWDNVTTFKAGIEWGRGSDMVWRAGFSHAQQPIASTEVLFNILAPAVVEDHLSFGFSKKQNKNNELSIALTYVLDGDVSGPNTFDPTQTIKLEMSQWEIEVGYGWH